jgi:hypothetical protein
MARLASACALFTIYGAFRVDGMRRGEVAIPAFQAVVV